MRSQHAALVSSACAVRWSPHHRGANRVAAGIDGRAAWQQGDGGSAAAVVLQGSQVQLGLRLERGAAAGSIGRQVEVVYRQDAAWQVRAVRRGGAGVYDGVAQRGGCAGAPVGDTFARDAPRAYLGKSAVGHVQGAPVGDVRANGAAVAGEGAVGDHQGAAVLDGAAAAGLPDVVREGAVGDEQAAAVIDGTARAGVVVGEQAVIDGESTAVGDASIVEAKIGIKRCEGNC